MKNIYIRMKDGGIETWSYDEYTKYTYDGNAFIIVYEEQWVGIYNIDSIESVVVKEADIIRRYYRRKDV